MEALMKRRSFVRLAGVGAVSAVAESVISAQQRRTPASSNGARKALMRVGTQHGDSDVILRAMAGFGVTHICSRLPSVKLDDKWSVDSLSRFREHVESFGISLDMMPLPMSSNDISRFELPTIMLGKSRDRDREIDDVCQMIRNTARAGIPSLKYNLTFLGVVRTESTRGRGGAAYSTFVYDKAKPATPVTTAGANDEDVYW